MVSKEQIKDYIENSESDILFEKFIGFLDNDNDIIYEPQGLFNKQILNDTGRITKKKGNVHIELNRPGFYDILPLGLFHNKIDEINNQSQFIEKVEAEKRTFRNLFLPFDSEIFSTSAKIERESNNHFKYTFDSEISVSLMKFFRIFDEVELLSIYEILFVDCLNSVKNKNKDLNNRELFNLIFHNNISPYKLMVNMLDVAQYDSKIKRFLNVLTMATGEVGNIQSIEKILKYIFFKEFHIRKIGNRKKYHNKIKTNTIGSSFLNASANSLIIGDFFENELELVEIEIVNDSENSMLQSQYIDGCFNKLLRLILSFFLSYDTEYQIAFQPSHSKRDVGLQAFKLDPVPANSFEDLHVRRNEILMKFKKISPYQDSFHHSFDEDVKFMIKEYFNFYYSESVGSDSDYTFLSMNTKI